MLYNLSLSLSAYLVFVFLIASIGAMLYYFCQNIRYPRSVFASLSVSLSIVLYTSLYLVLRLSGLSVSASVYLVVAVAVILMIIFLIRLFRGGSAETKKLLDYLAGFFRKRQWMLYGMVLMYLLVLSNYLFRNGYTPEGDLILTNMFNSEILWHLTIVNGLEYDVLPKTLHFIQTDVSLYHYFPNLFIHLMQKVSGVADGFILIVYFYVPVLLIILALNVYTVALLLWRHYYLALGAVLISLVAYDLSAVILWVRGLIVEQHLWFGSTIPDYLSVWTPIITFFQYFYNIPQLFSTAVFFGCVILLIVYSTQKNRLIFIFLVLSMVFLFKAKLTTYVVAIISVAIYSAYQVFIRKQWRYGFLIAAIFVTSLPFLLISGGQKRNNIEFSNWYFPANFAERAHFISKDERKQLEERLLPETTSGAIRFIAAFMIYYLGLFHFRLIAFVFIFRIRKIIAWIQEQDVHLFLISGIFVGLLMFIFIGNQLRKYDSMWFFLLIAFILNLYVVKILYEWFTSHRKFLKILATGMVILILATTTSFLIPVLQTRWMTAVILSQEEVAAYRFLKTVDPAGRVITPYFDLTAPGDEKNQFIMALSGRKVVTEGVNYLFEYRSQEPDYLDSLCTIRGDVKRFYNTEKADEALAILDKYQVDYVFLKKPDQLAFDARSYLEVVFNNQHVMIMKYRKD